MLARTPNSPLPAALASPLPRGSLPARAASFPNRGAHTPWRPSLPSFPAEGHQRQRAVIPQRLELTHPAIGNLWIPAWVTTHSHLHLTRVCRIPGPSRPAYSLGLSATSQQYFSLRTNQPPATSRNQPAVLFSQNKPAPAISHQPTEQAVNRRPGTKLKE
jgi:hypothetical protein